MSTTTLNWPETDTTVKSFISPQFLLRLGGLPFDTVGALRFTATGRWVEEVLDLESRLAEKRDALVEVLHVAIHEHAADQPLQRILINLKRDIFNQRTPKGLGKASAAIAVLSNTARPRLEEWLEQTCQHSELLKSGQQVFETEMTAQRSRLKEVLRDKDFRNGLLLSSPTLESDLDNYLKAPNHKLNRRLRLVERAALLYLLRTACKTSPFGTLGVVASGEIDSTLPETIDEVSYLLTDTDKRSFVKLNVAILSRLTHLMLSSTDLQGEFRVRLKDGWEIQGKRLRFLRRTFNVNLGSGPQDLDNVQENTFYIPFSQTLRQVIEHLKDGREVRLDELAREIISDRAYEEEKGHTIKEFLAHLLQLDLLIVPGLQLQLSRPDLLTLYRQTLGGLDHPTASLVAGHLLAVESLLEVYHAASYTERRQLLARLREELEACYAALGDHDVEVPRALVYEDATIETPRLAISERGWHERLETLADIQRLLPIYDSNVNSRLVMSAFFKEGFGAGQQCDDVFAFTEIFTQDYFEQYQKHRWTLLRPQTDADGQLLPTLNHLKVSEITMLDQLRQVMADQISRSLAESPAGSQEIVLSRDSVRAITTNVPKNVSKVLSHSFFTQLAQTAEGPRLVLNQTYGGLTQMFSRFVYPLEGSDDGGELAERLRTTLAELQPEGAIFAELQGGYDSNLNLHPPVTRYEIICPGDSSARPERERIMLGDLYIKHDESSDMLRLYSRRLRREVIPIYLGFLLPGALSQLRQVLINFSYYTLSQLTLWGGVKGAPEVGGDQIAFFPRIRCEEVVMQRAMWKFTPGIFPQHQPNEADADYFLRVSKWRRLNNLPRQAFVAIDRGDLGRRQKAAEVTAIEPVVETTVEAVAETVAESATEAQGKVNGEVAGARAAKETKEVAAIEQLIFKPLYVDFENYFTILLLERLVSNTSRILTMTEMLPGQDHLWLRHDGHPYVTEFVFEINRVEESNNE
jgi:hypothetical protein